MTPNLVRKNTKPQYRRMLQLAAFCARLSVQSPKRLAALGRAVAAAALDFEFDARSPFPELPRPLGQALGRNWGLTPPHSLLEPGNQNLVGLNYLVSVAKALDARTIFEIGTYNGLTALTLARNIPGATVRTLDLPPGTNPALTILDGDVSNIARGFMRAYEGQPEQERIIQHLGDSATFEFAPFYGTCQLVYVDGAHSHEYVEHDTREALRMVADPGAVIWDDYWRLVPDVAHYLNSHPKQNMFRLQGSRLLIWLSNKALTGIVPLG